MKEILFDIYSIFEISAQKKNIIKKKNFILMTKTILHIMEKEY